MTGSGGVAGLTYTLLDVFTDRPLSGNPLAVFDDGSRLSGGEMQGVARELNLSETVFLLPSERDGHARVRIFTPAVELRFAGHPVLGAAFVVGSRTQASPVELETGAGVVPVALDYAGGEATFGWMRQPLPRLSGYERSADLLQALGLARAELPVECYDNGPRHVCVVLASEKDVGALRPDITALSSHEGVGVSCFAGSGASYKTRMFAPALGVAEDPATGSAAGPICLHLARHGRVAFGEELELRQGDEIGRPSLLRARVTGSRDRVESVEVGGSAVVVGRGELRPLGSGRS